MGMPETEFSENTPSRQPGEYGLAPAHTPRCSGVEESHMYPTIVWPGTELYLGVRHKPLLASRSQVQEKVHRTQFLPLTSKEAYFAPIETR